MENKVKKSIFEKFKHSVNPTKYEYFLKDKILDALIYLLVICSVAGVIQGGFLVAAVSKSEKILKDTLESSELKFEFSNGVLDLAEKQWMDEDGESLVIINTEKNIADIDDLRNITVHKKNVIAFLRDGFMIKSNDDKKIYTYIEAGLGNESFDNYGAEKYIDYMNIGKYLLIPYAIIVKYIGNIISALCVMLIGAVLSLVSKLNLKYGTLFVLAIYSLTIPNLIGMIFSIGSLDILISSVIMAVAFISIKKNKAL